MGDSIVDVAVEVPAGGAALPACPSAVEVAGWGVLPAGGVGVCVTPPALGVRVGVARAHPAQTSMAITNLSQWHGRAGMRAL